MVNLRDLEYMVEIAKAQSLSRAAEKIHITQPSLSRLVAKVEALYGVAIFDKNNLPWKLTYAGEIFMQKAKTILNINDELVKTMTEIGSSTEKVFTLASMYFEEKSILPRILRIFNAKYPDVKVKNLQSDSKIVTKMENFILENKADFSLVVLPLLYSGITAIPIKTYNIVLALPREHPLAEGYVQPSSADDLQSIDLSLLSNYPFIILKPGNSFREITFNICRKAGFTPKIIFEAYNFDTANSFVVAGAGATIILDEVINCYEPNQQAAYFKISNESVTLDEKTQTIAIAYKEGRQLDDIEKDFLEILKKNI